MRPTRTRYWPRPNATNGPLLRTAASSGGAESVTERIARPARIAECLDHSPLMFDALMISHHLSRGAAPAARAFVLRNVCCCEDSDLRKIRSHGRYWVVSGPCPPVLFPPRAKG
jgi:hypothetical protein